MTAPSAGASRPNSHITTEDHHDPVASTNAS